MPIRLLITFKIYPVGMLSLAPTGGLGDLLPFDKVKRNYANFATAIEEKKKKVTRPEILHHSCGPHL